MHGEFFAARLGEIGADQSLRIDERLRRVAVSLETLRGGEFGQSSKKVFGSLQAGIVRCAQRCDHNRGVNRVSRNLWWPLEHSQQDFALCSIIPFLHFFGALDPTVGNAVAKTYGVAIDRFSG